MRSGRVRLTRLSDEIYLEIKRAGAAASITSRLARLFIRPTEETGWETTAFTSRLGNLLLALKHNATIAAADVATTVYS